MVNAEMKVVVLALKIFQGKVMAKMLYGAEIGVEWKGYHLAGKKPLIILYK